MKNIIPGREEKEGLPSRFGISPKQIGLMVLADIAYALALNLFYVGNNIAAGGLAGVATVLNSFFNWPVGLTVLIMSVPIVIWGFMVKGFAYTVIALLTTAMYSLAVDLLSFLPTLTDDMVVAVICGGILYGLGASLTAKAHMSSGGTDLLAKILITKFKNLSIGTLYMFIDGTVVVIASVAYRNIESGIYAILAIGVCSVITDLMNKGFNRAQIFYIFADRNVDKIADEVMFTLERGVTSLYGTGKYTKEGKEILMVIVSPRQTPQLKSIVHKYDPTAFIVLVSANEILGQGFETTDMTSTIRDELETRKQLEELKHADEQERF